MVHCAGAIPQSEAHAHVVILVIFLPPMRAEPLTSSVAVGFEVPIPTFPPLDEIEAVLASSSSTELTTRFQDAEESWLPEVLVSAAVKPEESAAYPTPTPRIPRANAAQPAAFFKRFQTMRTEKKKKGTR